ncbi:hypothetical protein [Paractinoplanes maris]|nr:hypothetical protein [Actinoplanes maris]
MTAFVDDRTNEALRALWLAEHDDDTPDTHLAARTIPPPFPTDAPEGETR